MPEATHGSFPEVFHDTHTYKLMLSYLFFPYKTFNTENSLNNAKE